MNTFVTADLHLGHDAIRRFSQRPFVSVTEMDESIITSWNNHVGPKDLVYIVGDFAWKRHDIYLSALNGKKVLIRGNHDKMSQNQQRNFTEVHDLLVRKIEGQKVVFCHYAMCVWPDWMDGAWHLHGHSHGRLEEAGDSTRCDVGQDIWGYAPIPWAAIVAKLSHRSSPILRDADELIRCVRKNREFNLGILQRLG
ncbi:MAG: metallophosphoesterase [bacterium]